MMAVDSLIFQAFSAIHEESTELFSRALEIECRKERRKYLRKLKSKSVTRMCRIIESACGYECGLPEKLNDDELSLKYALEKCVSLKLQLREFDRRVLKPNRQIIRFERWWCQFGNDGNQHPEAYPYPDTADEVRRELSFRDSDEYLEMGKTYSWYLNRYDEIPSFADSTTHGKCDNCKIGLPVWRSCGYCAFAWFVDGQEDIYVKCMECFSPEHQRDLNEIKKCQNCGGPPNIVINVSKNDSSAPWIDEDWD